MINDSVREELVGKISNCVKPLENELREIKMSQQSKNAQPAPPAVVQKPVSTLKTTTMELAPKATNPTLVEFHSKNTTVPEWRLQLQNVVRQRQERENNETVAETAVPVQRAQLITSGSNALKAETVIEPKIVQHKNPTLNSALERIEKSRRQFLIEEELPAEPAAVPAKTGKNFPFYIAGKNNDIAPKPAEINPPINAFAKPKLAPSLKVEVEKEKLDTNKLPPLPKPAEVPVNFESTKVITKDVNPQIEETKTVETQINEVAATGIKIVEATKTEIKTSTIVQVNEMAEEEIEEYDDCASFAMRFNAGLFDLIIGSFTSLFLLAPFMLLGGNWLSTAGIFAFLATCALVMFIYQTTAIGLYGKTFGMRLFSLEVVDFETEDYPTFHQAAVSSAVYLLSLAIAGIGFLTMPFNDERRAVHDLVSGTLIVREEA